MSNVRGRTFHEKVQEWSVPLYEGKATARDVSDLMRVAQKTAEELTPDEASMDDAYYIEANEDELRVQFRTEWKP